MLEVADVRRPPHIAVDPLSTGGRGHLRRTNFRVPRGERWTARSWH
jgi:hypothetical protein